MKIKINLQIFVIILILIITRQIEIYAWLMLFAFIHELAHMLVGLMLKLKPKTLEIQPFGISVIFESLEQTEKKTILIAIAGPLINIILAMAFSFLHIKFQSLIVNANILLAICNLIPIYPLDGGRILKSIVKLKDEENKTDNIVMKISNILMIFLTIISSFLILIYKNIGLFIIIIYLWLIVIKENNRYNIKKKIYQIIQQKP